MFKFSFQLVKILKSILLVRSLKSHRLDARLSLSCIKPVHNMMFSDLLQVVETNCIKYVDETS